MNTVEPRKVGLCYVYRAVLRYFVFRSIVHYNLMHTNEGEPLWLLTNLYKLVLMEP